MHSAHRVMNELKNSLINDDNIINYLIPVTEGQSRVECVNPVLLSEKEYSAAKGKLDSAMKLVEEFTLSLSTKMNSEEYKGLLKQVESLKDRKLLAVQNQDFEMAARLRTEEKELLAKIDEL